MSFDLNVLFQKLTKDQLIALVAFFRHMSHCDQIGTSRHISFFVDGDGDFHPIIEMTYPALGEFGLTEEQFEHAVKAARLPSIIRIGHGDGFDVDNVKRFYQANTDNL